MSVQGNEAVQMALRAAWQDSEPGTDWAHEEGGFILRNADDSLIVERWPKGEQDTISVPPHANGRRGDRPIVATFHTHPNTGADYDQAPGLTDVRAVRLDPGLGHPEYEGEFVVARELVYQIARSGEIEIVGATDDVLGLA